MIRNSRVSDFFVALDPAVADLRRPAFSPISVKRTASLCLLSLLKTWSDLNSFANQTASHSLRGVVNGSDGRLPRRNPGF